MDTFLAIVSKREVRRYADRPVPTDVVQRVLAAGRLSGSALNRQPWRFLVLGSPELRAAVAGTVHAPDNLRGAALAVAIAVVGGRTADFDAGRAAQNMMLAAANDGLGSCPNGIADRARFAELVPLGEDERPVTVLSFGYPLAPRRPEERSPQEWIERARRKPASEVVVTL